MYPFSVNRNQKYFSPILNNAIRFFASIRVTLTLVEEPSTETDYFHPETYARRKEVRLHRAPFSSLFHLPSSIQGNRAPA